MDHYLYKYLVLHKQLCIPQLGSFTIQRENARYEEATGMLHPPTENIMFSDGVTPTSEKLFFDFLASEMGVDDVSAIKQFHDFSYNFRNHFTENGWAELKAVGRIEKNENGNIVFTATPRLTDLYPSLNQDGSILSLQNEVTVEEEIIDEENKDNWWIYAIALVILGAGALLFYYS
jgi:hypothetical protein